MMEPGRYIYFQFFLIYFINLIYIYIHFHFFFGFLLKSYSFSEAVQLFGKAALRGRLARLGSSALSPEELSATEDTARPPSQGQQHRGNLYKRNIFI